MPKADAIWNKSPDLIDDDGEVRELTGEDFRRGVPFSELPVEIRELMLGTKAAAFVPGADSVVEEEVTLKLSLLVLEKLRATGTGWEHRVDQVLREWLEKQKAS